MPDAGSPWSILWTAPAILLASMMIAWGAESAQFFMAQGFALVILAWMQTLPEFAIEANLAWHQKTTLLIANLTGAIRLLTGLGWPLIYCTAAISHRRKFGKPLDEVRLDAHQSVQVMGVMLSLIYVSVICWKGSLGVIDAVFLIAIYAVYLYVLRQLPAENVESIEDLERIPRAIVQARPGMRIGAISGLFLIGGGIICFATDPFLGSLSSLSVTLGVSQFIFIQWVAPFISEFPEGVSAFYWARAITDAPIALMNMVSSNITQWCMLAALLPLVLSLSRGTPSTIVFDAQQNVEVLMTLGQSLMGVLFLVSMRLVWWEAALIFILWVFQFALSLATPGPGLLGTLAFHIHSWTTTAYFVWAGVEVIRIALGHRKPRALAEFRAVWTEHLRA